jgi:hypothetical protein
MRKSLLAVFILGLFSVPAMAAHCPADIAAINAALETVSLGSDVQGQVEALRDQGQALHDAGDHAASQRTLAEAMRLILNNL